MRMFSGRVDRYDANHPVGVSDETQYANNNLGFHSRIGNPLVRGS